jgi:hypothetical protein
MKWLFILALIVSTAQAETSKLIPLFLEAVDVYQTSPEADLYLQPEIRSIVKVLKEKNISLSSLEHLRFAKAQFDLPADDKYDAWIKNSAGNKTDIEIPEISFQASKIDVIDPQQYSDDIYAYFFVTDGVIPTGKVTSIYKGVSSGEGFFFNPLDRSIFPLTGIPAKAPTNHLIIDYGIIESDGDDIKKLQELSSIIIDIAIAVYSTQDPQTGQILMNLRKEIKALSDLLLAQNNDDRLATGTLAYTSTEIACLLKDKSFVDIKRNHKKQSDFESWEYDIHFRILK